MPKYSKTKPKKVAATSRNICSVAKPAVIGPVSVAADSDDRNGRRVTRSRSKSVPRNTASLDLPSKRRRNQIMSDALGLEIPNYPVGSQPDGSQLTQAEAEQLQSIDHEEVDDRNPDHVRVSVNSAEAGEFPIEGDGDLDPRRVIPVDENMGNVHQEAGHESDESDSEISFNRNAGQRGVTMTDQRAQEEGFDHLRDNPAFQNYVQQLVTKEVATKTNDGNQGGHVTTPPVGRSVTRGSGNNNANRLVKSPSDTTLYALLLNRLTGRSNVNAQPLVNAVNNGLEDQISCFVEGVQLQPQGEPSPGRQAIEEMPEQSVLEPPDEGPSTSRRG